MGIQLIIGGVSMLSMICILETCVVLIFCLIAMSCGNSYMLSSKVGKSIYKGFNARYTRDLMLVAYVFQSLALYICPA